MKDLPNWIKKILDKDNLTCGVCNNLVTAKNLVSVGIQKSNKKPHNEVLCIGTICDSCKEMTVFELNEMTLLDLAFEILEEQSRVQDEKKGNSVGEEIHNPVERNSKMTKSKITKTEIKDSAEFLNSIKNHDEFLLALGMSLEEIESYKIQKKEEK